MLVKAQVLKPGFILKRDIYSRSTAPLMRAGTVLTEEHIAFLRAFLIQSVEVESHLSSGQKLMAKDVAAENQSEQPSEEIGNSSRPKTLNDQYREAVLCYAAFFKNWQSGAGLDIGLFRKIMIPLLEGVMKDPAWLSRYLTGTMMTRSHADRNIALGLLAAFLARKLNESPGDVTQIGLVGMLADCGLSKLPPSLFNHEGHYIGGDHTLFERHVADSYTLLRNVPSLKDEFVIAVTQHHELEDGSGYPLHLTGNQMSIPGKILAVCDHLLDEMTKEHRNGSIISCMDWMAANEFGKLSKYILDKLEMEIMTLFIGTKVELSTGQRGKIQFVMDEFPTRPIISLDSNQVIALSANRALRIVSVG
ncbi:MAG: HD domain-containing phosphohydrolase [Sporolactobacillus sp.]